MSSRRCVFTTIAAGLVLAAVSIVQAADPAPKEKPKESEDQPQIVRLVLAPAAPPKAALKYELLPGFLQRRPGNAAVLYNKIGLGLGNEGIGKMDEKVAKWIDTPLNDLPRKEVREALNQYHQTLDDLDLAARRETCDWELPIRERNFVTILLPELQMARSYARLLAVKARLEMAEGKMDEALRTLQTGLALGRHVSQGPTLINGLVGMAIVQMMLTQVEELIQQPGAPNLYWALTALPRPLVDLRGAMETEMNMLYLSFPELADLDNPHRSAESWQALIDKIVDSVRSWGAVEGPEWQTRLGITVLAIKGYPQAKQHLIEQGRTPQEVEAMPAAQVVAIYTMETYHEIRDEIFKWFYVPYWEARTGLEQAQKQLERGKSREIVPLASLLLPAISQVHATAARSERRVGVLRVIEALRLHAANSQGRLPAKLADIAEVPVPMDPMTGQAFLYQSDGRTAILEAVAPPGSFAKAYGLRYEIQLNR